jgi:hypothetical protein
MGRRHQGDEVDHYGHEHLGRYTGVGTGQQQVAHRVRPLRPAAARGDDRSGSSAV